MIGSSEAPGRVGAGEGSQDVLPPFFASAVGGCAALAVALLLVTSARYGYHRDELYFVVAARPMAWGYVDQPREPQVRADSDPPAGLVGGAGLADRAVGAVA